MKEETQELPENSANSEENQGTEQSSGTNQTEEVQAGSVTEEREQPEFSHPSLKGKTPAEIDTLFRLAEEAVKEQRAELDALHRTSNLRETPPAPKEEEKIGPNDFFDDPVKAMEIAARRAVRSEMQEQFEPFIRDLKQREQGSVREKLRQELSDFARYESHIDQLLAQNNFPNPNDRGLLVSLYYMAKGMVASQPNYDGGQTVTREENESRRTPAPAPPQHRPSSTPMPTPQKQAPPPLTEAEKRMMTEWGLNEQEWRAFQNADPNEVITLDVGGKNG